ncbi:MAG: DUF2917 domain-containing protein [Betaproteobacteria bacterium]
MPFDRPAAPTVRNVSLARRNTLVLDDARKGVISVDRGCVWITLQDDPRDVVLLPGMRFEIDRDGRTLITAEEDSRLHISRPATWAERAVAAFAKVRARHSPRRTAAASATAKRSAFESACGGTRAIVPYY